MGSLDDTINKKLKSIFNNQATDQHGCSSWPEKSHKKRPSGDYPHKKSKKTKGVIEGLPDDAGDGVSVSDTVDGHERGPIVPISSESDEDETYEPEIDLSCSSEFDSDYEDSTMTKKGTSDEASKASGSKMGILDPFGDNMFDSLLIKHPLSPKWTPSQHVADYNTFWLRREIPKEVRPQLRSECPRPSLPDKITVTPELDPNVVSFFNKGGKDTRRGLDRGLKSCQDRLMDITGPLTSFFEMAETAYLSDSQVDPKEMCEWAQRAVCLLGNANTALSNERRKSILLKLDPKLIELTNKEGGPASQGQLFGDNFIKEMAKYVGIFSSIQKSQKDIRKVFHDRVFAKAGGARGRFPGQGTPSFGPYMA